MNPLYILKKLIPLLIFLLGGNLTFGQEKLDIAAGVGFPEMVNIGLRFQLNQSQLGLYAGAIPGVDDNLFTIGADYYYHFSGSSNFSTRRPWYVKAGLSYIHSENEYIKETSLFFVPRIGRDFNISRRVGIGLEGGAFLLLDYNEVELKPQDCWLCGGGFVSIGPSFSLSVFYRL